MMENDPDTGTERYYDIPVMATGYMTVQILASSREEAEREALDHAYDCPFPDDFGPWEVNRG